jgi:hypothetical protein
MRELLLLASDEDQKNGMGKPVGSSWSLCFRLCGAGSRVLVHGEQTKPKR